MRTFTTQPTKDSPKRPWSINITTGTLLAIQQQTGVNLYDAPMGVPADIEKLEDAQTLVAILYAAIQDQAVAAGLTLQQFADQLTGRDAREAVEVFMEELADFFTDLRPAKGDLFRMIWRQSQEIEEAMTTAAKMASGQESTSSTDSLALSE